MKLVSNKCGKMTKVSVSQYLKCKNNCIFIHHLSINTTCGSKISKSFARKISCKTKRISIEYLDPSLKMDRRWRVGLHEEFFHRYKV